MRGNSYESFSEFREACQTAGRRTELYSEYVLGKVYSSVQLKHIAREYCNVANDTIEETVSVRQKGLRRRYDISNWIARQLPAPELGGILGREDHDFNFPILSYFELPNKMPCSSLKEFSDRIRATCADTTPFTEDTYSLLRENASFFNGIINPPGRAVELESISIHPDRDIVSLLYCCSRILVAPDGEQGDYTSYFLARIPVLVRLLFRYALIEISMPTFAEPAGATPHTEQIPERYQKIVVQARAKLQDLLPLSLDSINYGKVSLYLETALQAQDMGWRIAPQTTADFDLMQRLIPLRTIFDDFQESLARECERRNIPSPLKGIDLYRIFRALKEQSYTYVFELNAPVGSRGGNSRVSALYGPQNSEYDPIFWVPKNRDSVADSLREAVKLSQSTPISNPYNLDALLSSG